MEKRKVKVRERIEERKRNTFYHTCAERKSNFALSHESQFELQLPTESKRSASELFDFFFIRLKTGTVWMKKVKG